MVGGLASSVVWPGAVQCEFGDVWHCQFCGRKVLLADIYIYDGVWCLQFCGVVHRDFGGFGNGVL